MLAFLVLGFAALAAPAYVALMVAAGSLAILAMFDRRSVRDHRRNRNAKEAPAHRVDSGHDGSLFGEKIA